MNNYIFPLLLLVLLVQGCYQEKVLENPTSPVITLHGFEYLNDNDVARELSIDTMLLLLEIYDAQNDFGFEPDDEIFDPLTDMPNHNIIIDLYDENNDLIDFGEQNFNLTIRKSSTNLYFIAASNEDNNQGITTGVTNYNLNAFRQEVLWITNIFRGRGSLIEIDKNYYFRIKAIDRAGNVSNEVSTPLF